MSDKKKKPPLQQEDALSREDALARELARHKAEMTAIERHDTTAREDVVNPRRGEVIAAGRERLGRELARHKDEMAAIELELGPRRREAIAEAQASRAGIDAEVARRRAGRPTTEGREGEKSTLGIRASATLKARLQEAADRNGRSLSQEAEIRLEQSFRDDDLLPQLMAGAYGRQLAAMLMVMGAAMSDVGRVVAATEVKTPNWLEDWFNNPFTFDQAARAAHIVLQSFAPDGDASVPHDSKYKNAPDLADYKAKSHIKVVLGQLKVESHLHWAEIIRSMLGSSVLNRIQRRIRP